VSAQVTKTRIQNTQANAAVSDSFSTGPTSQKIFRRGTNTSNTSNPRTRKKPLTTIHNNSALPTKINLLPGQNHAINRKSQSPHFDQLSAGAAPQKVNNFLTNSAKPGYKAGSDKV